jgi:hypothetical protein
MTIIFLLTQLEQHVADKLIVIPPLLDVLNVLVDIIQLVHSARPKLDVLPQQMQNVRLAIIMKKVMQSEVIHIHRLMRLAINPLQK